MDPKVLKLKDRVKLGAKEISNFSLENFSWKNRRNWKKIEGKIFTNLLKNALISRLLAINF
jgi:hypothetical protein